MPNIITHTLFADDILKELDLKAFTQRKQLFEVGSSGPDILFFHRGFMRPPFKPSPLPKAGSRLHREFVNSFYESALKSIEAQENFQIRMDMIVYVCGHLCHWALDSVMHPYIFYRTGNGQGKSASSHHRFESLLDAAMLKMKRNQTIAEYDITKEVTDVPDWQVRAISRVYVPALADTLHLEVPYTSIHETLRDWNATQKLFRDPSGKKIRLLQKVEKPLRLDNQFSGYAVPFVVQDDIDVFNLLHKPWKNPVSEKESDDSVPDLLKKARHRALKAIRLFLSAVADPQQTGAFLAYLDDRDYLSGLNSRQPMHCFEPADVSL